MQLKDSVLFKLIQGLLLLFASYMGCSATQAEYWKEVGCPPTEPFTCCTLSGHTAEVTCITFTPDGKFLLSGSADQTVKIWDTLNGKLTVTLLCGAAVSSVGCSFDGQIIACGTCKGEILLWRIDGEKIKTLGGHTGCVKVAFSPDNTLLASGADKEIKLWSVQTWEVLRTLNAHEGVIRGIVFSPDGKLIASCSDDNTVKVWEASTGDLVTVFTGHTYYDVNCIAFDPTGSKIASASSDRTVKIWDALTGRVINSIRAHTYYEVTAVSFSPDGRLLATGSVDHSIKIWDIATGVLIETLRGHTDDVSFLAFHPSGNFIASSSYDNTIKLWYIANLYPPKP